MQFLKALTAAIAGVIIVASSASAESSIGCDGGGPADSTVTATACRLSSHEDTSVSQAYAAARKSRGSRTYAVAEGWYFVPFTDWGRRDPHKTGINGGAGN